MAAPSSRAAAGADRAAVPAPRHGPAARPKRVLLTGPNPRLVLAQHDRRDRQLLDVLERLSA